MEKSEIRCYNINDACMEKTQRLELLFLIKHSVFEWLYMCETKNGKENLTI